MVMALHGWQSLDPQSFSDCSLDLATLSPELPFCSPGVNSSGCSILPHYLYTVFFIWVLYKLWMKCQGSCCSLSVHSAIFLGEIISKTLPGQVRRWLMSSSGSILNLLDTIESSWKMLRLNEEKTDKVSGGMCVCAASVARAMALSLSLLLCYSWWSLFSLSLSYRSGTQRLVYIRATGERIRSYAHSLFLLLWCRRAYSLWGCQLVWKPPLRSTAVSFFIRWPL